MNCLEFRRRCLAEPQSNDSGFLRHKSECANCADFAARMGQVEEKLSQALRVDVPENLASRIILRQSLNEGRFQHRRRRPMYALAAGVLLAVGLAGGLFTMISKPSFNQAVMTHLEGEWDSLVVRDDLTAQKLATVLQAVGGELRGSLGNVRHASICNFSKNGGAHLVLEGDQGPVIALLLPEAHVARSEVVYTEKLDGLIVSTNDGSMVIAGEKGTALEETALGVRSAMVWRF